MGIVEGEGTQPSRFNWPVRFVLEMLIKNPTISAHAIDKAFQELKKSCTGDKKIPFGRVGAEIFREGELADAIRYRIDLAQRKYRDGGGTCFVSVKLIENNQKHYAAFERSVFDVKGVIEWDQISGADADYLVRVSGRVASDRAKQVMVDLGQLECVERSFTNPDVTIWKSGVVDNFSPDDFLEIEEYPSSVIKALESKSLRLDSVR